LDDWQQGICIGGNNRTLPMHILEDMHRDKWRTLACMNTFITRHKAIVYAIYREYHGHATTSALDAYGGNSMPALGDWAAACRAVDLKAANLSQKLQFQTDMEKLSRGSARKAFSRLADNLKKDWSATEYEERYGALLGLTSSRWTARNRIGVSSSNNKRRRTAADADADATTPTRL
jgi:hypothetical protein